MHTAFMLHLFSLHLKVALLCQHKHSFSPLISVRASSITTPWSNSMSSKSTSSVIVMSLDSNSALNH